MTRTHPYPRQRGMALPTTLGLTLLCGAVVLAQWHSVGLHEALAHHQVDVLRTRERAWSVLPQALPALRAATQDPNAQETLLRTLSQTTCSPDICRPLGIDTLDSDNSLDAWTQRIHQAHSASASAGDASAAAAWYWIEVWPTPPLSTDAPVRLLFRVTVLAQGLHPGSRQLVQAYWQAPDALNTPATDHSVWLSRRNTAP